MALRTGTGGFIKLADTSGASITGVPGTPKMKISRWTLDIPSDEGDDTGFEPTNNLRTAVKGNSDVRGTFEGYLDDTNVLSSATLVDPEAAAATITLQMNRTAPTGATVAQQMTVSGYLSNVAIGCRPGEPNSISGAFFGTGAPTFAKGNPTMP